MVRSFGTLLARADFENDYHYRLSFLKMIFIFIFISCVRKKSLLEILRLSKSLRLKSRFKVGGTT